WRAPPSSTHGSKLGHHLLSLPAGGSLPRRTIRLYWMHLHAFVANSTAAFGSSETVLFVMSSSGALYSSESPTTYTSQVSTRSRSSTWRVRGSSYTHRVPKDFPVRSSKRWHAVCRW